MSNHTDHRGLGGHFPKKDCIICIQEEPSKDELIEYFKEQSKYYQKAYWGLAFDIAKLLADLRNESLDSDIEEAYKRLSGE